LIVADASRMPYRDASFDFAYGINVLHHITDPDARARAFAEVVRVLRPGGQFLLQEMNSSNPVLRFYLGYVYPVMYPIDDGTEVWIDPRQLPAVPGARWEPDVRYFTFIPEFVPEATMKGLAPLEQRLERSRISRAGAHFIARMVRTADHAADPAGQGTTVR
jgi:SAM-dependent methyltransferase